MFMNRLKYNKYSFVKHCRRFCDKNNKNDSTVDNLGVDNEKAQKRKAASRKLESLLEQLTVKSQTTEPEKKSSFMLNLAKPLVHNRKEWKENNKKQTIVQAAVKTEEDGIEKIKPKMASAVRSVAKEIGGDTQKTESELIQKLREHARERAEFKGTRQTVNMNVKSLISEMKLTSGGGKDDVELSYSQDDKPKKLENRLAEVIQHIESEPLPPVDENDTVHTESEPLPPVDENDTVHTESELLQRLRAHMKGEGTVDDKDSGTYDSKMSRLFTGVKIDRTKKQERPRVEDRRFDINGRRSRESSVAGLYESRTEMGLHQNAFLTDSKGESVSLFGSTPLMWFKTKAEVDSSSGHPVLETWDTLRKHELKLSISHPYANAYEEMIAWTEQGKMWKFPIDNEQGLEEEAKIGFEQHVFLEPHLEGFPEKGPIRHFMELVSVGLSKNPYITVQRKVEHIEWFRKYFKEKEALLLEAGAIDEHIT